MTLCCDRFKECSSLQIHGMHGARFAVVVELRNQGARGMRLDRILLRRPALNAAPFAREDGTQPGLVLSNYAL